MAMARFRAQSAAIFVCPAAFSKLLPPPRGSGNCSGTRCFSSSLMGKKAWRGVGKLRLSQLALGSGKVAETRSLPQRFSVKAIHVSGPGAVDSPLMQAMRTKIKEDLNAESVSVKDAYGDGRHVSIDVIASVFEGKSAVNRQRLVYKAIWEELQETVHAVDQLKTRTPSEAENSTGRL